jgi:hypothetical protein
MMEPYCSTEVLPPLATLIKVIKNYNYKNFYLAFLNSATMYLSALMLLLSLTDRAVVSSLRFYFTFKFSEASNGATTLSPTTFIVTTLSMTFDIKTLIVLANACHYSVAMERNQL